MLPAFTSCPAKRLTPRIFGFESRPLRVEPCPFLCAMTRYLSGLDLGDLDDGHVLTVTVAAHVVLATTELEDHELVAARLLDDLAGDLRTRDERLTDRHVAAVTRRNEKNLIEHDLGACIAGELLDHDGLARLDSVLL